MAKFINVTSLNDRRFFLNADYIVEMTRVEKVDSSYTSLTMAAGSCSVYHGCRYKVKETPEEILKLIED